MRTLFIILCLTLFPALAWGQFNPTDPDEPSSLLPTADFEVNVHMNKVKCYNSSKRGTRYSWDFGDGTNSNEKSPMHVYEKAGTYTITLVVKNGKGEVSDSLGVEIASEEDWRLEGSLTLDKYSSDVWNYTTLDDFFNDLLKMKMGYGWRLSVSENQKFELLSVDLKERKDGIIQKIKEVGSDYFEIEGNEYNPPVLKLWPEFNKENFLTFMELSEYIQFSGLVIEIGTTRLNLNYMERMWQPDVCSGGNTQEISFSNFSSTFQYEWKLKKEPVAITGYERSGTNMIPSMCLENSSTEVDTLEYEISFKYGNEVYYTMPYEIRVLPSKIELADVKPQNGGTIDNPNNVYIYWKEAWWAYDDLFDFYIWESGGVQPTEPYLKGRSGSSVSVDDFCQNDKKYNWKIVVHTNCSDIESEIYSFSVSQSADLEVQAVRLPETSFLSGQKLHLTASIINRGDRATTSGSWTDCLYISDQDVFDQDKALLLASANHSEVLQGGEGYDVEFSAVVPRLEGVRYLFVRADANQSLWEDFNTDNNVLVSDPIKITVTDLERIENTIPVNQEVLSSEVIDFSWKGSLSVPKYELYLWQAGEERPYEPLVKDIFAVRCTVSDFCKFGNSYVWQVVGVDEYGIPMSEGPLNTFEIKDAPDLHVTEITCQEAWSGQPLAISWTVRNDGKGETGNSMWSDNVWLVSDLSKGISALPVMTMDNVKALSPGESYSRTVTVPISERTAGSYYIIVAADMSSVSNIDWSSVENEIPDPYTPDISGNPYFYLKGYSGVGSLMEVGERGGISDNFFYKKIEINVSDLPDLQVRSVIPPAIPSIAGQQVSIAATIVNEGKKAVESNVAWYDEIFISPTKEFDKNSAKSLDRVWHKGGLAIGEEYTVSFDVKIPEGTKDGSYYFYVKTDVNDDVYEHALSENNMTASENGYHVINESIYEIKVSGLNLSQGEVGWAASLEIQGKGHNIGVMETDVYAWTDYVYASKNGEKLDDSAALLGGIYHFGRLKRNEEYGIKGRVSVEGLEAGEYYIYLVVNGDGRVADNDSDNNVIRSESVVKVVYPDLSVSGLSVPAVLNAGCSYPISYTIQNTGSDIENYTIADKLYFHDKNGNLVKTLNLNHKVSLKQGTSLIYSTQLYVPVLPVDGEYVLSVNVNGKRSLQETSDENNVSERKNVRYTRYKTDENGSPLYDEDGNLLKEPVLDLSLRTVNAPATEVTTSTEFLVSWMVENVGAIINDDWHTDIYARQGDDRLSLKSVGGGNLEENGLYHGEASISIPDNYAWASHLDFEIWVGTSMSDGNSENNYVTVPISVKTAPLPDLKLKNVRCSSLVAGNNATLTYEVENIGAGETRVEEWNDCVYLTDNISLSNPIAIKINRKKLSSGDSYKESISFTVPENYNGNYNLFLKIDSDDVLYEGDEKENNMEQLFVIVSSPSTNPTDLTVEKAQIPNSYVVGAPISIRWTVKNSDQYPTAGTLKDAIYLSEDQGWDESDLLVGTVSGTVSLQAGESVERVATGIINSAVPGRYYVIIRTNQLNSILESDYQNNATASAATCQVDFRELAIGSNVQVDGQGFFKLAAEKGESLLLHLEADGTEKGFNLYMAHDRVATVTEYDYASVQPNEPYQEILVPEMEAGTYYILAQQREFVSGVENNFTLGESTSEVERMQMTLSSKLLEFGISRMDKPEGGNGGSATSTVYGAKFDSIMDYRLKRDNRVLPAEAIYFQNSSESVVTFNLNEEVVGTYDVVVEKQGGTKREVKSGYTVVQDSPNKLLTKIIASSSFRSGTTNPVTIEYANDGLSDVVVSELLLVSENGHPIGMTAKDTGKGETVLRIPIVEPGTNQPMSVAPGGKGTFTVYIYAGSVTTVSLQLYVIE